MSGCTWWSRESGFMAGSLSETRSGRGAGAPGEKGWITANDTSLPFPLEVTSVLCGAIVACCAELAEADTCMEERTRMSSRGFWH